jgi:hypothetical protein
MASCPREQACTYFDVNRACTSNRSLIARAVLMVRYASSKALTPVSREVDAFIFR